MLDWENFCPIALRVGLVVNELTLLFQSTSASLCPVFTPLLHAHILSSTVDVIQI
jgi:hypothetical protein